MLSARKSLKTTMENRKTMKATIICRNRLYDRWVMMKQEVANFIRNYPKEYKTHNLVHTSWRMPVVAFADAKDPMFLKLREIVDPAHFLPTDLLPNARTVISYFIPFTKETVQSNSKGANASEQWARAYAETNKLIMDLNTALSDMLSSRGLKVVATMPTYNFDKAKLVSCWSQKSIANIAGLGKFGLHHMIITEKGCCGRLGSVVTNAKIKPTQRNSGEYCLYKLNGSCGICIKRCALKALKADGHDKHTCYKECLRNAKKYAKLDLADVCGKCVSNAPCSFTNPSKKTERKA